ncbi:MAG: hypothetical protein ACK502_09085 [Alphaproteobacteria bacterium]
MKMNTKNLLMSFAAIVIAGTVSANAQMVSNVKGTLAADGTLTVKSFGTGNPNDPTLKYYCGAAYDLTPRDITRQLNALAGDVATTFAKNGGAKGTINKVCFDCHPQRTLKICFDVKPVSTVTGYDSVTSADTGTDSGLLLQQTQGSGKPAQQQGF